MKKRSLALMLAGCADTDAPEETEAAALSPERIRHP